MSNDYALLRVLWQRHSLKARSMHDTKGRFLVHVLFSRIFWPVVKFFVDCL